MEYLFFILMTVDQLKSKPLGPGPWVWVRPAENRTEGLQVGKRRAKQLATPHHSPILN